MKERPILFSAPMVRALLDGSKTQTRRAYKVRYHPDIGCEMDASELAREPQHVIDRCCPYGRPGDQLRVRETFFAYGRWETRFSEKKKRDEWHFVDMTAECDRVYQFAADNPDLPLAAGRGGALPGWYKRPAIFMPRAASRILLEIISVRVERLNDCSEPDARAEGITDGGCVCCGAAEPCGCPNPSPDARDAYVSLWESINGAGSWGANPWVWAVTFKRVTP